MLKHYFKTAWRHILRQKTYAVINITGLALGICACILIYVITSFEFSFDNFHPDKDRIYCIDAGMPNSTDEHDHWNSVPAPMPAAMRRELSGLETVAAFIRYNADVTIPAGKGRAKKFDGRGSILTEPQFFAALTKPSTSLRTE